MRRTRRLVGARRPKLNHAILAELKQALAAARRERCAVDEVHQAAMALYLDTWVVAPLESAIAAITKPPEAATA